MIAHTTSNNLSIFLYPDLVHSVMRSFFGLDDTGEARIPLNNTNTVLLSTLWYVYSCLCVQFLVAGKFLFFILYKFHWVWHVLATLKLNE